MKEVKKVAVVILSLAIIAIICATAWYCLTQVDTTPSTISVEYNGGSASYVTQKETEPETIEEPSVVLIDRSGSMDGLIPAIAGYDTVKEFGLDNTSHITTEIIGELKFYRNRIGVVSDLESYPSEEFDLVKNVPTSYYKGVELVFFVPADVDEEWLKLYEEEYDRILDPHTSTLKFVQNGKVIFCPFDNFKNKTEGSKAGEATFSTTDGEFSVRAVENKDNVPMMAFVILAALFGIVALGLIIALICLVGNSEKETDTPEGIKRALTADGVALDGSGSVETIYQDFIAWCKKENIKSVYRFAEEVQNISITDAESRPAGGKTCGFEALRKMADDGCKVISVVSDFKFNDEQSNAENVSFDKIYLVGRDIGKTEIDLMTQYAASVEIVRI